VAAALCAFMATRSQWVGIARDLWNELGNVVGEMQRKSKDWPSSPRGLSGRLRRVASVLRKVGIEIVFDRDQSTRTRERTIRISAGR
jgi:hypothetical protein